MYGKLLVAFVLVAAVSANLDYQDCGSTAAISAVTLTGCDAQPCTIIKGQDYTLRAFGQSRNPASELPYTVKATVLGIPITLYEGNACESLEVGSCPHVANVDFVYARVMNVGASIPQLNSVATALVKDETGRTVICASLRVEIRNA